MKNIKFVLVSVILLIGMSACEYERIHPGDGLDTNPETLKGNSPGKLVNKVTGFVEIIWKGGEKGSNMGNKPDSLLCFFKVSAHEGSYLNWPKGELVYTVLKPDSTLHREISASVYDVYIDVATNKAWVLGMVVSDTKGCAGNGEGGHDSGCSSGGHDTGDEGCGDETSHDGGCSHDDTGTGSEGGCETDTTGTHDDSGGCEGGGGSSGGMGEEGGMGGPGGMGGTSHGNPLSGKNCRLGQLIAVKMHDGGIPGTVADGVTWKWFFADGTFVPSIENMNLWPHLCKKTIIGGNIMIHEMPSR